MYGDFGFVNNVIFNWYNRSIDGGDHRSRYNIINNYYKPGPITPLDKPIAYRIIKPEGHRGEKDSLILGRAFVDGNIVDGFPKVTMDNWNGGVQVDGDPEATKAYWPNLRMEAPFPLAPITILPAQEAYAFVLENVGATLPVRDAVDKRIVKEVKTGKLEDRQSGETAEGEKYNTNKILGDDSYKKGIITHISQVGGYPEYKGKPYKDTDKDGMPDKWERTYNLNPNDPSDANGDLNGDGYTNIEKYINGIDPTKKVNWEDVSNNKNTLTKALLQ
jgi:hypothetical protein